MLTSPSPVLVTIVMQRERDLLIKDSLINREYISVTLQNKLV